MSETLKPCPWCGGKPETSRAGGSEHPGLFIECMNDGCPVHPHVSYIPPDAAIAAWNRRAPAPAGEAPATVTIQREVFDRLACGHGFMLDEECDWPSCSFNEVRDALRAAGRKG